MNEKKTFRPVPGLSREAEEKQLALILDTAQENLEKTRKNIQTLSEDIHDLIETYGPKDKEGLSLLHNTQSQLRESQRELLRYERARKKPYFGRIDFKDSKIPWEESYYVGRVGITKDSTDPLVIDWRAPVASVYYENALGPCSYTVKDHGTYNIDLRRKCTYEIENDHLKDFYDSDIVATDELLNKYLAKSKKAVLGEIIATIQKEQNQIIRKSPKTNMIVQGVAGSGKTTVAMHRISYILYNYEETFRPEDFYIIGSNRILLNYITSVLPDLDVYGVSQMTMEQLFVRLLYEEWDGEKYQIIPADKNDKSSCLKGSLEWFRDLENFCREYERQQIPREEIRLKRGRRLIMSGTAIENYLKDNPLMSMQSKIRMLNKILMAKLENELNCVGTIYTLEERKELFRTYRKHFGGRNWKGSVYDFYREFLQTQQEKGKTAPFQESAFDLYDLGALAYIYKRIKETDGIREASHVIIDEAQDFGMMAYGVLDYCLRGCTYTVMGDVSQNIHFGWGLNDWKELQELLLASPRDTFGILKKSYRNTVEISRFATEILRHGNFPVYPVDPVERHGKEVSLVPYRKEKMVLETVKILQNWQKEGHETIGVICRDQEEASWLSGCLKEHLSLAESDLERAEFGEGIMVLPVEYTKGLEFDAVLLYDPSKEKYPWEDGYVKLLYVAATRALHELAVVHGENLTELIGKPVSREKHMKFLEGKTQKTEKNPEKKQDRDTDRIQKEGQPRREISNKIPALKKRTAAGAGTSEESRKNGAKSPEISGKEPQEKPAEDIRLIQKAPRPLPVNPSPRHFGDIPDTQVLKNLMIQERIHPRELEITEVKKSRAWLTLKGAYGTLRLTPLGEAVIRVQFVRENEGKFPQGYWDSEPETGVNWSARAGKDTVELATDMLIVRIRKKTGALTFFDRQGRKLLEENPEIPRQLDGISRTWAYFQWPKEEKIFAKGILAGNQEPLSHKARYISFGGKKMRMPLIYSYQGYGISIGAGHTVLGCDIPMYGTYVYTEGEAQADYYFIYGDYETVVRQHKKLGV